MKNLLYLFIVCLTIVSCSEDFTPEDEQDIISYLENNNIDATRTTNGLYYTIEEEGTGKNPIENSNVTVAYKGYLLDGTTFDESPSSGITFDLDRVIPGWTLGIPFFKEGGKGKLFIHPSLGYGNQSVGNIPPGSVLVFDIHLISVNNKNNIELYLQENNINANKTEQGLYYLIEEEGTGESPTANSNVTVAYKGYLLNGTVFDESSSTGISFNLNQVISGWTLGIPLFKEGGKGKLFIPPSLGYGNQAIGSIPPDSALVFDINLISVN